MNIDRVNFNHLFYFYVVAKEGSIKQASEKLFITQPTISDQLKLLEEYFECKLFERRHRSLFLTEEGKMALSYAEEIFNKSKEMTYNLRNRNDFPKKTIDIGINYNMSHYFIYDNILPLLEQDEIAVNIQSRERHYLLADLEEGKIDLVFSDSKEGLSNSLKATRIGINRTFVVAHKKYRHLKKNFPESLSEASFFNYTPSTFLRFEIDLFLRQNGVVSKIIGEADDVDLLQLVTEQGLAYTIVPEVAKKRFCMNKDVIVLGEIKDFQSSVWAIMKHGYRGLGYQLLKNKLISGKK